MPVSEETSRGRWRCSMTPQKIPNAMVTKDMVMAAGRYPTNWPKETTVSGSAAMMPMNPRDSP